MDSVLKLKEQILKSHKLIFNRTFQLNLLSLQSLHLCISLFAKLLIFFWIMFSFLSVCFIIVIFWCEQAERGFFFIQYVSHRREHIILSVGLYPEALLRLSPRIVGHVSVVLSAFLEVIITKTAILVRRLSCSFVLVEWLKTDLLSRQIWTNRFVVSAAHTAYCSPHA